jgi:hypothetical protein
MRTWALIKNNIVENVIVWDGESEWTSPESFIVVEITNSNTSIGWTYIDGVFEPPLLPVEIIPEQLPENAEDTEYTSI